MRIRSASGRASERRPRVFQRMNNLAQCAVVLADGSRSTDCAVARGALRAQGLREIGDVGDWGCRASGSPHLSHDRRRDRPNGAPAIAAHAAGERLVEKSVADGAGWRQHAPPTMRWRTGIRPRGIRDLGLGIRRVTGVTRSRSGAPLVIPRAVQHLSDRLDEDNPLLRSGSGTSLRR